MGNCCSYKDADRGKEGMKGMERRGVTYMPSQGLYNIEIESYKITHFLCIVKFLIGLFSANLNVTRPGFQVWHWLENVQVLHGHVFHNSS